jgi:aspartyl-tRNA synthetase
MRTAYNNEFRLSDVGKTVTVVGWVAKKRNLGGLVFVDLRDRTGIVQIVCKPENPTYQALETARNEYVLKVTGKVVERESKNKNLPTGDIEIEAEEVVILNEAKQPPLIIADTTDALEEVRMKYRYLDLRRPVMQRTLMLRHQIARSVRNYFDENGFIDIETPVIGKSTPEGARDYLIPSRLYPGKFYALPQSPQIYKQLLMVSGFDRYYQIVKCFRDEDSRSDRQMEFTQIDVEMSFIDEEDIYTLIEKLFYRIMKEVKGLEINIPFPRLTYPEALDLYGTDKPDTRFEMKLATLNDLFKDSSFTVFQNVISTGGVIKALNVKGGATLTRKAIENLGEEIHKYKAKGLLWVKYDNNTFTGPLAKYLEGYEAKLIEQLGIENGDLVLIVAGPRKIAATALGYLRNKLAKELGLIPEDVYNFLWITDWPAFEYDEEAGRYEVAHHPFTSVKDSDVGKILTHPEECIAKCYDIVLNGYELGSGSIRIHDQKVQADVFKLIGLSDEEVKDKFGFFIEALKYGTPPHGGIALGLDRLTMILTGAQSLRDVIAFPKTANAIDPMSESPSYVTDEQLEELKLVIKK